MPRSAVLASFAVCLLPFSAAAQLVPPIRGIGRITYAVADPPRTAAFFGRLGFQVAFQGNLPDGHPALFVKIADRQYIALTAGSGGMRSLSFDVEAAEFFRDFYLHQRGLQPLPMARTPTGNSGFLLPGPPVAPSGHPQQIEFIQSLPGSAQSNDTGKHLGPNRIATELLAIGVPFTDRSPARDFYLQKLSFELAAGRPWSVELPGPSTEQVLLELSTDRPRLYLHIPTLEGTAAELRKRGIPFRTVPGALELTDPDGNLIELESAHMPVAVGSAEK